MKKMKKEYKENVVIAVVGAGGKTSLILHYSGLLNRRGIPVLITTTTHMYAPKEGFYREGQYKEIKEALGQKKIVWVGEPTGDGKKIKGVSGGFLEELCTLPATVFIEADGAKHFPCKVPAEWEPVIPENADIVIGVAGLDCLGKSLSDGCFRAELAAELLHTDITHRITEKDLAELLSHPKGTKKGVPAKAEYIVVLNKCDLPGAAEAGKRIQSLLLEKGCNKVILR